MASLFSPVKWSHPTAENRRVQPDSSRSCPSVGPGTGKLGVGVEPVPITLILSCSYSSGPSTFIPVGEAGVLATVRAERGQAETQATWTGGHRCPFSHPLHMLSPSEVDRPSGTLDCFPCITLQWGRGAVCLPGPECPPPPRALPR